MSQPRNSKCWCGAEPLPNRATCSDEHASLASRHRPRSIPTCWCGVLALPRRRTCCDEHVRTRAGAGGFDRVCVACGVAFHTSQRGQRTCSDACREACRPEPRVCVHCGSAIPAHIRRQTCSDACISARVALRVARTQDATADRRRARARKYERTSGYRGRDKAEIVARLNQEQDGRCAVCLKPGDITDGSLSLDHDHASGSARGLLCRTCNIALGQVHDSAIKCAQLYNYLVEHSGVGLPRISYDGKKGLKFVRARSSRINLVELITHAHGVRHDHQ